MTCYRCVGDVALNKSAQIKIKKHKFQRDALWIYKGQKKTVSTSYHFVYMYLLPVAMLLL